MSPAPASRSFLSGPRAIPFQAPQGNLAILAGSAHPKLAAIADMLGVPLTPCEALYFSEGNVFVRVLDNVRGCDGSDPSGTPFGWTPAWGKR